MLEATPESIQQEFNLSDTPYIEPRFNIAPSQPIAVITNDKPDEITHVQWGLVPSWSKDVKIGYKMINARSETADSKPSFRSPFKYRRCIIPTSGFYEWVKGDDGKQPYYIQATDRDVYGFAGLWEVWRDPEGSELWTATILTCDANEYIGQYHHRMPVILNQPDYEVWLDKETEVGELKMLMQSYPADKMNAYPVSKAVNTPKNDNPMLIERDEPPQQQSMF